MLCPTWTFRAREASSKVAKVQGVGLRASYRSPQTRLAQGSVLRVVAFKEDEKAKEQTNLPTYQSYEMEAPPRAGQLQSMSLLPAFTRQREHLVGRIAMLGVCAMWAGEVLTGAGPMTQLAMELQVPVSWAFWATAFLAMSHLVIGVSPGSGTFGEANQRDVGRRTRGLTGVAAIEPDATDRMDGVGKLLLRSELVLGRTAMLGAMLLEFAWAGDSPLARMGLIGPPATLGAASTWMKVAMGTLALGSLGLFSNFNSNKAPDAY